MGLIHSHASKKRDKQMAKLFKEQRKQTKVQRQQDAPVRNTTPDPSRPLLLQPTMGALISEARRRKAERDATSA
jgi:hypothetical protein